MKSFTCIELKLITIEYPPNRLCEANISCILYSGQVFYKYHSRLSDRPSAKTIINFNLLKFLLFLGVKAPLGIVAMNDKK